LVGYAPAERVPIVNELTDRWVASHYPIGTEFSDKAFVSTSKDVAAALDASTGKESGGMVFRILGGKGLDVGAMSRFADETEVILPRGSRFRVVGIERQELTDWQYDRSYSRAVVTVQWIGT
jgi:hypothetical protein